MQKRLQALTEPPAIDPNELSSMSAASSIPLSKVLDGFTAEEPLLVREQNGWKCPECFAKENDGRKPADCRHRTLSAP